MHRNYFSNELVTFMCDDFKPQINALKEEEWFSQIVPTSAISIVSFFCNSPADFGVKLAPFMMLLSAARLQLAYYASQILEELLPTHIQFSIFAKVIEWLDVATHRVSGHYLVTAEKLPAMYSADVGLAVIREIAQKVFARDTSICSSHNVCFATPGVLSFYNDYNNELFKSYAEKINAEKAFDKNTNAGHKSVFGADF